MMNVTLVRKNKYQRIVQVQNRHHYHLIVLALKNCCFLFVNQQLTHEMFLKTNAVTSEY